MYRVMWLDELDDIKSIVLEDVHSKREAIAVTRERFKDSVLKRIEAVFVPE